MLSIRFFIVKFRLYSNAFCTHFIKFRYYIPDILRQKVEDVCKIGDMMWVKVTEIDEKGRVNLSHKDALREIEEKKARGEVIK